MRSWWNSVGIVGSTCDWPDIHLIIINLLLFDFFVPDYQSFHHINCWCNKFLCRLSLCDSLSEENYSICIYNVPAKCTILPAECRSSYSSYLREISAMARGMKEHSVEEKRIQVSKGHQSTNNITGYGYARCSYRMIIFLLYIYGDSFSLFLHGIHFAYGEFHSVL